MKFVSLIAAILLCAQSLLGQAVKQKEFVVYFETPLVCGAKESIGCGSRAKPLLLDLEATAFVREAWLNHEGTIVAIALEEPYLPMRQLLGKAKKIFDAHEISFKPISGAKKHEALTANFRMPGKWYRGTEVDSLSWEEAAWLTAKLMPYLETKELAEERVASLEWEINYSIGAALTGSNTSEEELQTQLINICANYVGIESVKKSIERYYADQQVEMYTSTITCPKCGYKKTETLPADRCIMEYTCEACRTVIKHKKGDCCVFCSYGDVKCPTAE